MKMQFAPKHLSVIIVVISLIYLISCQKEANRATSAKIIYTDIIPDTVVAPIGTMSTIYKLDLDNDGDNDFTFSCVWYATQCRSTGSSGFRVHVEVNPADNSFNEILNEVYPTNFDTVPAALDRLYEIGSASGEWLSASSQYLKYVNTCCCSGGDYWFDYDVDKYMGLKLVKGSEVFYGWVRLNVVVLDDISGTALRLKDYAYNSRPNEFILAGQNE